MLKNYVLFLKNNSLERYKFILPLISKRKMEKVETYKNIMDKKLSILGELLIKKAISDFYKNNLFKVNIMTDYMGKPYYINENEKIFFNLSHTKNAILCSITDTGEIGVDIEKISDVDCELIYSISTDNEIKK